MKILNHNVIKNDYQQGMQVTLPLLQLQRLFCYYYNNPPDVQFQNRNVLSSLHCYRHHCSQPISALSFSVRCSATLTSFGRYPTSLERWDSNPHYKNGGEACKLYPFELRSEISAEGFEPSLPVSCRQIGMLSTTLYGQPVTHVPSPFLGGLRFTVLLWLIGNRGLEPRQNTAYKAAALDQLS